MSCTVCMPRKCESQISNESSTKAIVSFHVYYKVSERKSPFVVQVESYSLSRICYPYICMNLRESFKNGHAANVIIMIIKLQCYIIVHILYYTIQICNLIQYYTLTRNQQMVHYETSCTLYYPVETNPDVLNHLIHVLPVLSAKHIHMFSR